MLSLRSAAVAVLLATGITASPAAKKIQKRYTYKDAPRNPDYTLDIVDELEASTMPKVEEWMATKENTNGCTLENAAVRREWSDLSVEEREEYIAAVLCLTKLPAKSQSDAAPGVLSRYDDFVHTHMTQAMMLHSPAQLFASHRYYIWAYEKALRDECGYTGYQPYMNYERYADDPVNSPLFNGNMSSMGGNGLPTDYPGVPMGFRPPYNKIPQGGGGGCVTEGPFKDMVVSLGPVGTVVKNIPVNPQRDGRGTNPRCLRRDVNKYSVAGARANYTYSLIQDNPEINAFYNRYLGQPQLKDDPNPWGLHNAGHYLIGGDPGGDFYCSPGDPLFYFHHGALDRIWWIWQMQDPATRTPLIPGMAAMGMNHPMKRQGGGGQQPTIIDLQWTAPAIELTKLTDQLGGNEGQFCYVYV